MRGQLEGLTGERLREFKASRAASVAFVTPLSQEQLDFQPRAGNWSIGEVAEHLRISETVWRGEIERLVVLARSGRPARVKRSFGDLNVAPLFLPDSVLTAVQGPLGFMTRLVPHSVINAITEYPILPTRNPDVATPRAGVPRGELVTGLTAEFERTRLVLEENADLDFEAMTSEHPLTGKTNIPQMLDFLIRHERRHQRQMERVRTDARFPPAPRAS